MAELAELTRDIAPAPPVAPDPKPPETPAPPASPPASPLPGEPPAPEKFEAKPGKTKELREAYERQSTELKTLNAQLAEAQAKLAAVGEIKSDELLAQIKALETERETMAKDLAFVSYERSPDYRKSYVEPVTTAFANAFADIEEMTVTDPATGDERQATNEDFNKLVSVPIKDAARLAGEMFGPLAQQMLTHRNEIVRLDRKRVTAINDYKKNSAEYEKQHQTTMAARNLQQRQTWETANKEIAEKFPEYFKPDQNDPTGNELLQKGFQYFDAAVNHNSQLAPEQRTRLLAAMRHKAASFDRVALKLNAANKKISELETALAEFDESTPGGEVRTTANGKPPGPAAVKSWQEELNELAAAP